MLQYFETLTDDSGNSLYGATCVVTTYPGGTAASIYSSNSVASPIAASTVISDITGQISFYVPDGAYTLSYYYKGTLYKTKSPVQMLDPMGFVYATDTGTANTLVITSSAYPAGLYVGLKIQVLVANTNTGSTTLNLNSTGAQTVRTPSSSTLTANALIAGGIYLFEWLGSSWQLISNQAVSVYPVTPQETAAGVTPSNLFYQPGDPRRYGGVGGATSAGIPSTDDSSAFATAVLTGTVYVAPGWSFKVVTGTTRSGAITMTGTGTLYCDGFILTLTNCDYSYIGGVNFAPISVPLVAQFITVNNIQTTAVCVSNSATITVASATGIAVGQRAMGPCLWNSTTVIGVSGTTITLNNGCSAAPTWSSGTNYVPGNIVAYSGSQYLCILASSAGTLPTNATYWSTQLPVEFFSLVTNTALTTSALTNSLNDGYRPPSVNDAMWASMSSAQKTASQIGPVLSILGNHCVVENVTAKFISILFQGGSYNTVRNCDLKGGWTWGAIAYLNFTTSRSIANAALGNRIREHAFEGIMLMGQDQPRVEHNYVYGCGDSGIESYQSIGSSNNSTYFDGCTGIVSVGNICVANFQGAFNYESNAGSGQVGYNTAMSSSSGDYAAWHPLGAVAYTGWGWSVNGLVCEYNAGAAIYAVITNSVMNGITLRENGYNNFGGFNIFGIIGYGNIISNVRAFQETNRSTAYTMSVSGGSSLTGDNTLRNIDLRDLITPASACLTTSGKISRENVRTNLPSSGAYNDCPPVNQPFVYALLGTTQTLTSSTPAAVQFGSTGLIDDYGVYNSGTYKFIGLPAGRYKVTSTLVLQTTGSAATDLFLFPSVNGATSASNQFVAHITPTAASQNYTISACMILPITNVTDYIQVIAESIGQNMTLENASCVVLERLGD
jgi:hypothetical protein